MPDNLIYPCLIRIIHVYPKHRWKLYDPKITLSISKYPCPEISIEPKIYPFIPKYPHLTRNIPLYYYYKIPMSILKYPPLFQNIPLYPEISPFIPKIPFYLKISPFIPKYPSIHKLSNLQVFIWGMFSRAYVSKGLCSQGPMFQVPNPSKK